MSTCPQEEYRMLRPLCHVYGAEKVFAAYSFRSGVKRTFQKHKRELKQYIEEIMSKAFIRKDVYFDPKIHYYVERTSLRSFFPGIVDKLYRYFETLEDLLIYRNYDLTHTDLTKDIELKYDFSKCKIDNSTKLPVANNEDFKYEIEKYYDAGRFHVWQGWYDDKDNLLKEYDHKFDFFFDFVAFLRGDLSDADLIMCRGLLNLKDISGIDFTDAMLTSGFCDKFGLKYQKTKINSSKVVSFAETQNFEIKTDVALHSSRETVALGDIYSTTRVYYMFDLHLLHKIEHAHAKSQNDVLYVVRSIVNAIVNEAGGIILLGGDVASDFNIFKLFISELRNELDNQNRHSEVFFVLGNHELWDFPHLKFESIVRKYKRLLSDYGMFLLQNEIMFLDSDGVWGRISASEIVRLSNQQIRKNLRTARIILFGGLAFSGCNKEFNAENGIYRSTISRTQEVEESLRFKELYDVVLEKIPEKRVVVFTHMPMDCWSEKVEYHKGYVYVSGHTHRNFFYDDGETRVYSDNQIGYRNNSPHLKWLALENDYDYFSDYADGVYKIPKSSYIQFYKGKNIDITFTRDVLYIYMLKKKGYHCFIYPASNGSLMMLNGGAIKKLKEKDIQYYYDHMDQVVNMIKRPLDKYSDIQRSVSAEIRKIGGSGHIHGCIIDIDWYNHVYINPHDLKITGYWASSIIDKKVYPSVTALLEKECPLLYANYTKLINGGTEQLPVLYKGNSLDVSSLPETYLSTDIYSVSYEIKKLQKLNSNILSVWYDINTQQKQIGQKRKR